jgi:hypothetical protein
MPKIQQRYDIVPLEGYRYLVSTTIEPIVGDYAICRSLIDKNSIVKVIASDGCYISYLENNEVRQHPISCTSKIMASSDKSLGLPSIQEEMLPYVSFVEEVHKTWSSQQKEFDVVIIHDALADCIIIHADDSDKLWEILISKARGKYMLTNIRIENGKRKVTSTTEYERLLLLLGAIFITFTIRSNF